MVKYKVSKKTNKKEISIHRFVLKPFYKNYNWIFYIRQKLTYISYIISITKPILIIAKNVGNHYLN